jgi:hypothetical protein
MPEYVFTTSSPWVVGREALLEDAVEDYLHEMTRQQPWLRARYEALLGSLVASIEAELAGPPPLRALTRERSSAWLATVAERELAQRALTSFADYLVRWRWLEAHPLRVPYAV